MNMTEVLEGKEKVFHENREYYAHLLDNVGPLPREISLVLPQKVFYAIWGEFYHYLSLVAETANPGGGGLFTNYIESNVGFVGLPSLSEITDYLVNGDVMEYPDKQKLGFWLNINALLEYGRLYEDLPEREQVLSRRFEYLQELDHFSEIMDLSLLTKHISKGADELDASAVQDCGHDLSKYLSDSACCENAYKPIAGRSQYVNLGLERMLGEAAAKRKVGDYSLYPNEASQIGDYKKNYYSVGPRAKAEAQFKVMDKASVGSIRTNYPYLALLLTSNSPEPLDQDQVKKLNNVCVDLILQYGLERGLAMFDGYIFDAGYQEFMLSAVAAQVFRPAEDQPAHVKIVSVGQGAAFVYQNNRVQHVEVMGSAEEGSFIGITGSSYRRKIVTVESALDNIKVILAPHAYGKALEAFSLEELKAQGDLNAQNPLAWIAKLPSSDFVMPKAARNLLAMRMIPEVMQVVHSPSWSPEEISGIDGFIELKNTCRSYLENYDHLEVNVLYAHLHADRFVDVHQLISTKVAKALFDDLDGERISFNLQPLVDNLHVRDTFDYRKYEQILKEQELEPDVILTEDSLLIDRIGQGILYDISKQDSNPDCKIIYEGDRAMNLLFSDTTVVQLIDHMNKDGRLACVSFDLAQIYYRQAPEMYERIFREEILEDYADTTLGLLFEQNPGKNYHEIMYEKVYALEDVKHRNQLFVKIANEVRRKINSIEDTRPMERYVNALREDVAGREQAKSKKVISLYILEGSYDAQFDRYSKVHKTFSVKDIDTYRVSFVADELKIQSMCIQS